MVDDRSRSGVADPQWSSPVRSTPPPAASGPRRAPGRLLGVRAGQVVAAQAAVALLLATSGARPVVAVASVLVAATLVLVAWVRLRRRWLFEWLAVGIRYMTRRHRLAATADRAALLELLSPTAQPLPGDLDGDPATIIGDGNGLIAILELGDSRGILADAAQSLPAPASLLPAASPDAPPIRIQLLLSGSPAPALATGGSTPATSYRQLTDGRLLRYERALLTVRVLRAEGWSDEDLRRALSSTVRKVRRRLAPIPAHPVGESAALLLLAESAHHDNTQPAREEWQGLRLGGLVQSTFRLRRWPDLRSDTARQLVPRLLALPAAATTVSLSAGPRVAGGAEAVAVDLTVRLAARNAAGLSTATQALRRLLSAEGAVAWRLDGEHLDGLAATLPLGVTEAPGPQSALAVTPAHHPAMLDGLDLPIGSAGLMIGANRHGAPVTVRLFRAEATRVVLIGGVRAAQLIALRAMALGGRIVVQTTRPRAWEPFVRGASAPGEAIMVIPPERPVGGPAGTPLQPVLVVVDIGPVAADSQAGPGGRDRAVDPGWHASLVVRDELAATDVDALSRADLVLLQPLQPDEAALAAAALGLGESAEWLTRIREDMVAVVNQRALRWAQLSTTPIESQLIGPPTRR